MSVSNVLTAESLSAADKELLDHVISETWGKGYWEVKQEPNYNKFPSMDGRTESILTHYSYRSEVTLWVSRQDMEDETPLADIVTNISCRLPFRVGMMRDYDYTTDRDRFRLTFEGSDAEYINQVVSKRWIDEANPSEPNSPKINRYLATALF